MVQVPVHTDTNTNVSFWVAQRLMLVTRMNRWLGRLELALIGWDLGRRPDLLPENEDDFLDKESDREVRRTSRKHLRHRLGSGFRDGPEISISLSDEFKAEKEEAGQVGLWTKPRAVIVRVRKNNGTRTEMTKVFQ